MEKEPEEITKSESVKTSEDSDAIWRSARWHLVFGWHDFMLLVLLCITSFKKSFILKFQLVCDRPKDGQNDG